MRSTYIMLLLIIILLWQIPFLVLRFFNLVMLTFNAAKHIATIIIFAIFLHLLSMYYQSIAFCVTNVMLLLLLILTHP